MGGVPHGSAKCERTLGSGCGEFPGAICCRFWMRSAVFGFGLVHFLLEPAYLQRRRRMQVAGCHFEGLACRACCRIKTAMQKIRFVARGKPDARPDSKSLQKENTLPAILPGVTLVIYGDEERYYYFAGQGHHVSPFYFRCPRG